MARGGLALALLGVMPACGRRPGPRPGETVAWVITSAEVGAEGCGEAEPLVDAAARVFAPDTGFVYAVGDDGRTAEEQHCPLVDGAFDLGACAGDGVAGVRDGDAWVFERAETVVDDGPCRFTLGDVRRVVDDGTEGALDAELTATATAADACSYAFEGEPVRPDGCRIAIAAGLALSDHAR